MLESSEERTKKLDEAYYSASKIVIIQILTTVFLVGSASVLVPKVDLSIGEQTIFLLWAVIVVLVVGIVGLQRYFLSAKRLKVVANSSGISGFVGELKIKTTLLGMSCVLIAVFGFIISLMSGNSIEMFRTAAIVFVVFLVIFPRKHIWQKLADYALNIER